MKFHIHDKIVKLKSLQNFVRDYIICHKSEMQRLLSTLTKRELFFSGFQDLEKGVMNFQHFSNFSRNCMKPVKIWFTLDPVI